MSHPAEQPRKRNAETTRQAIIAAAQRVFTDKGFDHAGTREIADMAGINIALISRYFGSKEGLFREAVLPALTVSADRVANAGDLATALTAMLMGKPDEIGFDPIIAMLRSANSETVGPLLHRTLEDQIVQPLASHLGATDAREKASAAMMVFFGYDVLVRMMRLRPFTDPDRVALEQRLKQVFQAALG